MNNHNLMRMQILKSASSPESSQKPHPKTTLRNQTTSTIANIRSRCNALNSRKAPIKYNTTRKRHEHAHEAAQKDKTPNKRIKPFVCTNIRKRKHTQLCQLPASTETHRATEQGSDISKSSANGTSSPSLAPPSRSINKSWRWAAVPSASSISDLSNLT